MDTSQTVTDFSQEAIVAHAADIQMSPVGSRYDPKRSRRIIQQYDLEVNVRGVESSRSNHSHESRPFKLDSSIIVER